MSGILPAAVLGGLKNGPIVTFQGLFSTTTGGGGVKAGETYTAAPLGVPAANRTIIVCCSLRENGVETIASVTIGGISATNVGQTFNSGTFVTGMVFWVAAVPTGTTGNIVVTYTNPVDSADGCAIWAAYGLTSTTPTALAHDFSTTAPNVSLNVSDGGCILACTWVQSVPSVATRWTGITANAEVVGDPITTQICSAGSLANLAAASPRTVSATYNGTSSAETCAFAASFR